MPPAPDSPRLPVRLILYMGTPDVAGTVMAEVRYALSFKQPWAALLVHGLKSIEVRAWPTARRGPVLIHAARNPDPRPEGWALVTDAVRADAELIGGVVGTAVLTGCRTYRTRAEFAAEDRK